MSKVTRIRIWLWAAVGVLAAVGAGRATPDWDPQNYSLSGKHVAFSIQYHVLTETERQYYKSMLAELDEFADSLKQSGKLGLGKVSFKILLDDWNPEIPASVEMSRSKGGYNCALNTHYTAKAGITVDRGYLARIIAYFASDGWESLVCEDCYDDGARSVAALKLFHRRLAPIAAVLGDSARAEKEMRSIEAERVRLERERKEAERERVKKEEQAKKEERIKKEEQVKKEERIKKEEHIKKEEQVKKENPAKEEARLKEHLAKTSDFFTDSRDGRKYRAVTIGGQVWMAENLNYKTADSWCFGDADSNCARYGRLYNWETAKSVCPAGYHLPSKEDWSALTAAAGGNAAGKALKSKIGWGEDGNGTDAYGFSALPGGHRYNYNGTFHYTRSVGAWWMVTSSASGGAIMIHQNSDKAEEAAGGKEYWFSVRCVGN